MNPALEHELLRSFFGPPRAGAEPLSPQAALDLPPGPAAPVMVAEALRYRLGLLAAHPLGGTPQGAAARAIVSAAAAALLAGGGGEAPPSAAVPDDVVSAASGSRVIPTPTGASVDAALLVEARRLLAARGGMDAAGIAHLRGVAVARGLPPEAAMRVIAALASSTDEPRHGPGGRRPDRMRDEPEEAGDDAPPERDEGQRMVRMAVVGVVVLLVGLGAALGGLALLVRSAARPPLAGAGGTLPQPPVVEKELARAASGEPDLRSDGSDDAQPDAAQLLREARTAAGAPAAEATRAFAAAHETLARWWFLLDAGQRTAAAESMVEAFLRGLSDAAAGQALVQAIRITTRPTGPAGADAAAGAALGPADVARIGWTAGLLARLARERDLPADVAATLRADLEAQIGRGVGGAATGFGTGARVALGRLPERIVPRAEGGAAPTNPARAAAAFERWQRCVVALGEGPGAAQESENLVLDGLEQVLLRSGEPGEDRAVHLVIQSTVARLRWRAGDPARARLLAWFARGEISNADLAAVTGALVRDSAAEGVDLTMALSPMATPEARAALRDRYARAWSLAVGGSGGSAAPTGAAWPAAAVAEIAAARERRTTLDDFRSAAVLSLLSQAAWRRARGDVQGAAELVATEVPRLKALALDPSSGGTLSPPARAGDGLWAVAFANERTAAAKVASLREIAAQATLSPADADVLAEAALDSAQAEVRAAAQQTARRFVDSPVFLAAMLKSLPRAQRSAGVADLIVHLASGGGVDGQGVRVRGPLMPAWTDPAWPLAARRVVVEALLERLSGGGSGNAIDTLSAVIAESYLRMAGETPPPDGVRGGEAGQAAARAAGALYTALRARCQRHPVNPRAAYTLDRLDARRAGRLALAVGPVQVFAAEQASCAEALGYLVCAERPAGAGQAAAALEALAQRRRGSESVADQLKATEATILRLHLLRAGEDGGSS